MYFAPFPTLALYCGKIADFTHQSFNACSRNDPDKFMHDYYNAVYVHY